MKKLMSLVLALAMILSLLPAAAKPRERHLTAQAIPSRKLPRLRTALSLKSDHLLIMPWSLGGGPDTIARQVASYGEKYLGVPVIVENHTGGSGTIAMNVHCRRRMTVIPWWLPTAPCSH